MVVKATTGAWWMPRRWKPMKDVARLRKASVCCPASLTGDLRMGEPASMNNWGIPTLEVGKGTGGTETSKYPEEKRLFP